MTMEINMVLDKIEAQQSNQLALGPAASSLDLLQAVYRDPTQHLSIRMRAAMACLPFECPKLAVTAIVNENEFATLLDQRIARLQQQKTIEARPTSETNGEKINTDTTLQPRIPYRRFRRI